MSFHSPVKACPNMLFLFLMAFTYVSIVCAKLPQCEKDCDDSATPKERWIFVIFHIVGVIGAAIASFTRLSYFSSRYWDLFMTCVFYIAVSGITCISIYVTYEYESADMLLIGAAVGMVAFGQHVPRFWSQQALNLHWMAPMWRVKNGELYKRVRDLRNPGQLTGEDWNGCVYHGTSVDGHPIYEVLEKDPKHWAHTTKFWQNFVCRGRLGEQAPRRAAMALRMAYSIPEPAWIRCGKSEYYAARGVLGTEVMSTWNIPNLESMIKYPGFQNNGNRRWIKCNGRMEMAYLIHIQLLVYKGRRENEAPDQNGNRAENNTNRDWAFLASDWLLGELVIENRPECIADAYAYGNITEVANDDGNDASQVDADATRKYWYLVGNRHERAAPPRNTQDTSAV